MCVRARAREEYGMIIYYASCIYFVELIKRGLLTFFGEIQRYGNDHFYYY